MNDWWKAPVLQGEENDYGDYDYLIEEVPSDRAEWTKWEYKCSECGKLRKWNKVYTHYFHTLDGYDSIPTEVCWVCKLKRFLFYPIKKFFKKIKKGVKDYIEYRKECRNMLKVVKGYKLTRHQKQFIKKCLKHK